MKTKFTFLNSPVLRGFAIGILLIFGSVLPGRAQDNLLVNPGFEDIPNFGTTWENWAFSKLNATYPYAGIVSLEVGPCDVGKAAGCAQNIYTGWQVGDSCLFSVWLRFNSIGEEAVIGVLCKTANDATRLVDATFVVSGTAENENTYVQYSKGFKIPANTGFVQPSVYWESTTNSVLLDDFSVVLINPNTSIKEVADKGTMKLYPNPLKGGQTLYLNTAGLSGKKTLSVFDMTGRMVYSEILQNNGNQTIELNNKVKKGSYITKISTSKGDISQLLIVQ